jgi:hypothetical protein
MGQIADAHNELDLYNLCLTSHRFHDIAQEHLYKTFRFLKREAGQYKPWERRKLFRFLHTLTERPELAALVKVVYIESLYDIEENLLCIKTIWQSGQQSY